MSDIDPPPQDGTERPPPVSAPDRAEATTQPCSDWQVLLLRYLPEPTGTAHAVKRFSAR